MSYGFMYYRRVGLMGLNIFFVRIFSGKKMSGRMGGERVIVLNLQVVKVDLERNLLFVKGSVSGNKNLFLIIRDFVKSR